MNLPLDCISEIIQYLDYRVLLPFTLTCKAYIAILQYHIKLRSPFSTIKLKYNQYLANCEIKQQLKNNNNVVLCAPMGYGKTITSLYYSFIENTIDNIAIVVPANVFKVWIKELIRLKLYHASMEKSKIYVEHSSRPHHINHNYIIDNIHLSHRVFITTSNILCKMKGNTDIVVIDEGHKIKIQNIKYKKLICLTANKQSINNKLNYIYHGFINREIIPTIKYNWFILNNNHCSRYYEHENDLVIYIDEFKTNLITCITKYNKTCIFVDRGNIGDLVLNIIKTNIPEYKIFKIINSLTTLESHLKYKGKSILLLSSMANDGLNLLVDNIILIKPDLYNISRIIQTFGRIARPNNLNKMVDVNIITNGRICILKIIYAIVYSNLDWQFNHEQLPSIDLLIKSEMISKLLGYNDIKNINMVDYAIIFDKYKGEERYYKIIDWWNIHKKNTKLTTDIIKNLYL